MQNHKRHRFSIAPMMDWTDRHCRYFHRILTKRATLYTEMVTTGAVIHGDRERLLGFNDFEQPVALQLGGSDPNDLARAAAIGLEFGYEEINLNCGCPSDRVQSGRFGACLMAEPDMVRDGVSAMIDAIGNAVPVTVKCRIGIDDQDSESALSRFVEMVSTAGCNIFIVHARKAWLKGLSPKENRDIPPLDYDRVYRLKVAFPQLTIVLNGGVDTIEHAEQHLMHVDGVMMGRAAYKQPMLLTQIDHHIFQEQDKALQPSLILQRMLPYVETAYTNGVRLNAITRHMIGLMNGRPKARQFRRLLAEESVKPSASIALLHQAIELAEQAEEWANSSQAA